MVKSGLCFSLLPVTSWTLGPRVHTYQSAGSLFASTCDLRTIIIAIFGRPISPKNLSHFIKTLELSKSIISKDNFRHIGKFDFDCTITYCRWLKVTASEVNMQQWPCHVATQAVYKVLKLVTHEDTNVWAQLQNVIALV